VSAQNLILMAREAANRTYCLQTRLGFNRWKNCLHNSVSIGYPARVLVHKDPHPIDTVRAINRAGLEVFVIDMSHSFYDRPRRARWKARIMAAQRRAMALLGRPTNPYPRTARGLCLSPSQSHWAEMDAIRPQLSYATTAGGDVGDWQREARAMLAAHTGYRTSTTIPEELSRVAMALPSGFHRTSHYLRVAPARDVPVHVITCPRFDAPQRVMICLHGTNSGAHMAWGEVRLPADHERLARGADFALQAAAQGWLAVVIEQSCFGERREKQLAKCSADPCIDAANHALLLGRTLIGERASDISAVFNWLHAESELKAPRGSPTVVLGHSSGGSAALLAAALDPRLNGVVASGCVGYWSDTIMRRADGSGQNIIPGILHWLEMDDVVGLCAPRPTLLISGTNDHIWPASGMVAVADSTTDIFAAAGAKDRIRAISVDGGHRFYPDETWRGVAELFDNAKS